MAERLEKEANRRRKAVKRKTLSSSYGKSNPVKRSYIVVESGGDKEGPIRVSQAGDHDSSSVERLFDDAKKRHPRWIYAVVVS